MAQKDVVFVAVGYYNKEIFEWVFDHFEIGETKLMITCFFTGDNDRAGFIEDVQRTYLPLCKINKFEADMLMPSEDNEESDIVFELITKHGMTKLAMPEYYFRKVVNACATIQIHACKIWCVKERELMWVRDSGEMEYNLQNEANLNQQAIKLLRPLKENASLLKEDKLFIGTISYSTEATRIIDWVLENFECDKSRIIIVQLASGSQQHFEYSFREYYLPQCTKQKFEAQVLILQHKKYIDRKLKELITIHEMETLIIDSSFISDVIQYFAKNLDHFCNIFVLHDEIKELIYFWGPNQIELLRKENDLHEEKRLQHLHRKQTEKLLSDTPQSTNKLEQKEKTTPEEHDKLQELLLKEIQNLLEIEKKKNTELNDELGKQKNLLEEESLRHQQSDNNLLRTINQLHEARSFLEIEIKNLKNDLAKKGTELQNKDKLHYGPGMANFSYAKLKKATNDFDDKLVIGEGGFGKVYRGIIHCTIIAIKILNEEGGQGEKEFNQEVKILQKVRHPNLITLIGACPEKGGLVYEYLPNGSLQDLLGTVEGRKSLSWKRRIKIASDTCSALIFLHNFEPHGIAHGDLKPANILLDSNFECKLSDLGICRELKLTDATTTPLHQTERPMGTRGYMDPTYNSTYEITTHNDVYAFGVILLQLVTGQEAINIRKLVEDALENKTENEVLDSSAEWPPQVAKKMMQLGMRCIQIVKKGRPDLANEVWGELESLKQFASSS